jgi:hypothetical protein
MLVLKLITVHHADKVAAFKPDTNDRKSAVVVPTSGDDRGVLMDALSDVLRAVRLSGAFFFDVHACAPWCAETPTGKTVVEAMFPGSDHLIPYHLLMAGSCWATLDGEEPIKL